MQKITSEWEKDYEKEFGHLGELWNGKKGQEDEMTVKSFISALILQSQKEAIEAVLVEKINFYNEKAHGISVKHYEEGFNSCRQQIIDNSKEKFNIEL